MLSNHLIPLFGLDVTVLGGQIMILMVFYAGAYALFGLRKYRGKLIVLTRDEREKARITGNAWTLVAIAISIGFSGTFAKDPHWSIPVLWFIALLICVSGMTRAEENSGYWDTGPK